MLESAHPRSTRIEALGDAALVIHFGERIDPLVNAHVLASTERLRAAAWPGILDLIPAYATLTVCYDPGEWLAAQLRERLLRLLSGRGPRDLHSSARARAPVEIPVCYEGEFAPDLEAVCAHTGLEAAEFVRRHHAAQYRVYFIGFMPGFPYLGGLDAALAVPRRATPRREVPPGSVAIGGEQTGIYPLATPGGWHIIGRTPLRLFDARRADPCLLRAGDRLRFVPVERREYQRLHEDLARGGA